MGYRSIRCVDCMYTDLLCASTLHLYTDLTAGGRMRVNHYARVSQCSTILHYRSKAGNDTQAIVGMLEAEPSPSSLPPASSVRWLVCSSLAQTDVRGGVLPKSG